MNEPEFRVNLRRLETAVFESLNKGVKSELQKQFREQFGYDKRLAFDPSVISLKELSLGPINIPGYRVVKINE